MALTWSISRDQILHTCERRYYFQYLAPARITSQNPLLREIGFLKKLKTLDMWKGSIFHNIIADYLHQARQDQPIDIDVFMERHKKNIETEWSYSLGKKYQKNLRELGHENTLALLEHEYGYDLPETMLHDVIRDVHNLFGPFYQWGTECSISQKLRKARQYWIEPRSFGKNAPGFYFDDVQVLVKVDLALKNDDGSFDIFDWKSGNAPTQPIRNIKQADLQLSVYQLWPHLRFNIPLDSIRTHLVYFGDNPPKHGISEMDGNKKGYILNLVGRSIARAKQFADLHSQEQTSLKDFDFASYSNACRFCAFKRICQRELAT